MSGSRVTRTTRTIPDNEHVRDKCPGERCWSAQTGHTDRLARTNPDRQDIPLKGMSVVRVSGLAGRFGPDRVRKGRKT